jgi:hypothetical protein
MKNNILFKLLIGMIAVFLLSSAMRAYQVNDGDMATNQPPITEPVQTESAEQITETDTASPIETMPAPVNTMAETEIVPAESTENPENTVEATVESSKSPTVAAATAIPASPGTLPLVNPLTGQSISNPDYLTYPPVLIPISRYPDGNRPSAGLSQAPWVFEMYANTGESRPIALFYGSLPETTKAMEPYVGAMSGALLGLESLRKQYQALLLTTGNPQYVEDAGILNNEKWFGLAGDEKYPDIPVAHIQNYLEKWKKRLVIPDIEGLTIPFSIGVVKEGKHGQSLFMRYASFNQILWQFDAKDGLYHRSQNSSSNPEIVEDVDILNDRPIAVQNLIVLFASHTLVGTEGNFTVNFNYVEKNPAIIFRDGIMYQVYWTTKSEAYERETERMRPIRFIDEAGNAFPLKPGQSWVHIISTGNPYYETSTALGNEVSQGTGFWKIPYISVKPEEKEIALSENKELVEILQVTK